ncbi:MAG: TldD/PmbA family protein [Prolixibacteraceae bacterium]|jgi:TldD protein|nr:TldD/PmbA family protein [Prolixibacteraceae bacterium]MBT6764363.1 TldD/PmbA family protein [Prolixibacteraceae bacterium]MBT6998153.1 TldD/PmbA family protein [Prolixibacteraceae bacterium]MBT7395695.1 TldD/PmbA family protein [Prolixibacteraceae bacterium]
MITNRRNFIKTSSAAMAGGLILPPLMNSCQNVQISENVKSYLDHFEVSTEMLQKVIATAMNKGGDYADLFFEHKISNSLGLEDGKVNKAYSNIDYGVGIRVLKGDQTGFAYSESISPDEMLNAAKMAANIANSNASISMGEVNEKIPSSYYPILNKWEDVSVKDKVPFVQKINDKVFSLDEKVLKVNAFLNDETSYVLFYNSEGRLTYDYRPMISFGVVCIMQKGDQIENAYSARSFRKGFEWLSDDLVDELAKEAVERTNILFEATKPKAGEMPVVMGAGGSGILLHEAIGHTFEADFNRKGTSIFSDKMGKKVAESYINIIDDGTLENNRGSINVDDEGNDVEKTYLVKDGVLNSYIHDRISSKHYKVNPTGNGRRESFRHIPLPRMRSTYMEVGPHSKDDIISNVDYGVYVDNFSNGQVQIGAGDFTFFVKSGYLIEKGKITQPIKDINIIGNGPQALADISMAANDYLIDNGTWTCGKDGQSVPVTCGLPTVLVKKLTVGGTNA